MLIKYTLLATLCLATIFEYGCSDPMQDKLPSTFTEWMMDTRYLPMPLSDKTAIARYYDRHKVFPGNSPITKDATVANALAEQRHYERINLFAMADGKGINTNTGEEISFYGVILWSVDNDIYDPIVGVSGVLDLLDEFNEILLSHEVRVYEPESDNRLSEIWIPMNPNEIRILSKIDSKKLSVCFRPNLKVKHKNGLIDEAQFPVCYRGSSDLWKASQDEKFRLRMKNVPAS